METPGESTELMVRALTAVQISAQVQRIQQVMKRVMQEGHHYGKIPGCGDKPTLFKAGAEKLLVTFRLATGEPQVTDLSTADCARYRIRVPIIDPATGNVWAVGIGECSSDEAKYKWRAPACDAEWDATLDDRRREKWTRDGRCYRQVRQVAADMANTVLKMAHKRALVCGTLLATAASDIFTQDLEDFETPPENGKPPVARPPLQEPQEIPASKTKPSPGAQTQAPAPQSAAPGYPISDAQRRRLFAILWDGATDKAEKDGRTSALTHALMDMQIASTKELSTADYEAVCELAKEIAKGATQ